MPTYTIEIKGISMVYEKNGEWRAIFPFKGCHLVYFSSDKTPDGQATRPNNIKLGDMHRRVTFAFDTVTSSFEKGDFSKFLDLNANYAHGADSLGTVGGWESGAVLMEVPNAALSALEYNNDLYALLGGGAPYTPAKGEMAYWAKMTITAKSLTVKITGHPDRTYSADTKLIFDNDCYGIKDDPNGDIKLVYQVVSTAGTKLSTVRPNGPKPKPWDFLFDLFSSIKGIVKDSTNGNGNPEEGKEGLPCHIVVLSDPPPNLP